MDPGGVVVIIRSPFQTKLQFYQVPGISGIKSQLLRDVRIELVVRSLQVSLEFKPLGLEAKFLQKMDTHYWISKFRDCTTKPTKTNSKVTLKIIDFSSKLTCLNHFCSNSPSTLLHDKRSHCNLPSNC